jgi:hypothetical protein
MLNTANVNWLDAVILMYIKEHLLVERFCFHFDNNLGNVKMLISVKISPFFGTNSHKYRVITEPERGCACVSRKRKVNCSTIFLHFGGLKSVRARLALISSNVKQSCVECVHGWRGFSIQLMATLQRADNGPRCSYDRELSLSSWETMLGRRTCGASNSCRETRGGGKPSVWTGIFCWNVIYQQHIYAG